MLVGKTGSGKTSLMQALLKLPQEYKKTQTIEAIGTIIDTPGEYMDRKNLFYALAVTALDAEEILLVVDCTDDMNTFMPNMNCIFNCPITGIVTKTDCAKNDQSISDAKELLCAAGVERIFYVSSVTGKGIDGLNRYLLQQYKIQR